MTGRESDDCLPPGWTVKVKVRKNGKKDRYYFNPSKEFKFKSRVEVFRHINRGRICHPKSKRKGGSTKPSAKNVSSEKAIVKGLPAGWTKEMKVTKNKNKIRKDSFYTDPTGRYVFRSLKGVLRYVESGKLERKAFKLKDKKQSAINSKHKQLLMPAQSKKDILSMDKARRRIIWDEKVLDPRNTIEEDNLNKSSSTEACSPALSNDGHATGRKTVKVNSSKPLMGQSRFSEPVLVSSTKDGFLSVSDVQSSGGETGRRKTKNAEVCNQKSRKRKEMNLPRRTSKRLAGLEADPTSELKVRNRVRGTPEEKDGKKMVESNGISSVTQKPLVEKENGKQVNNSTESSSNQETRSKIQGSCSSSKKYVGGNLKLLDENVSKERSETETIVEKNREPAVGLPLEELLTDPCIAFAIKTLTGDELHPPDSMAAACGAEITADEKTDTNEKANGIIDPLLKAPLGEIWADPCIEFAIKMLIGDIPIEDNLKNVLKAKPVNALVGDGAEKKQ